MNKTFLNAKDVKTKSESINEKRINAFIDVFNKKMSDPENSTGKSFSINDSFDGFEELTEAEFVECFNRASETGWTLSKKDDNNKSITYTMTKSNI